MAYPHSPLVAFVVGLVAVILLLVYWDLPAFIGLVIATFIVGLVASLSVHPAYLVMAIGAGGNIFSWYNDSGFWLVKEIGGLTQAETLKTWTALTSIISVTGIITVLIASSVFPLT